MTPPKSLGRRVSNPLRRAAVVAAIGWATVAPAFACDTAEKLRLADEEKSLAARNAWTGVERTYEALLATKCELGFEEHFLGAEAAKLLGKVFEQHERLNTALALAPAESADNPDRSSEAIKAAIAAIDEAYRKVQIVGDPRRRPVLTRPEMPFATDQRKAVEWAVKVVSETGSFKGMLPLGDYVVGDVSFKAEAGAEWQVVTVGKSKAPPPTPVPGGGNLSQAGGTVQQGALRYASIVATLGPSFLTSPEPKEAFAFSDAPQAQHQFAPDGLGLTGFAAQVGGELGLTYAEPALGVAATVGFQTGLGTDTFLLTNVALSGVVRPGQLRIAAGPQFQYTHGSGTGVASWFNIGQIGRENPTIPYAGSSWGPGLQGSVGYGLLDFNTLRGIVDLGGSWQTDGHRGFYTVGLRVGVVPTVPRFEG